MRSLIGSLLLLSACAETPESARVERTRSEAVTGTVTSPVPEECSRTSVATLTHLDEAAPGFDIAPSELVGDVTGWFEGDVLGERGRIDGYLEVDEALGRVRAVYQEGPGCTPYYEVGFTAWLGMGDELLDASFAALLQARSADDVRFGIRLPEAEVRGTLVPDDQWPVAGTELRIGGRFATGRTWEGELDWVWQDRVQPVGEFVFWGD